MRLTRRQLRRILQEAVSLDIEKGDVILTGKFKNKRTVVKDFGTDDLGQPTINGMKLLKFRIEKLMPQDKWSKKSQEEADLEEGKTMKITKRQLRRIIKEEKAKIIKEAQLSKIIQEGLMVPLLPVSEAGQLNLPLGGSDPSGGYEYGEFARTPEVQNMLMDAGFNADGSFGADGYPGPANWQLYSPKDMQEAKAWIQAALDMNDALRKAETALDRGEYRTGEDAHYGIVSPVQDKHSRTGAADTEGREVSANWFEQQGYEW